jgi:uncharacterized protein YdhG (YjbR/CyaY superfamily)
MSACSGRPTGPRRGGDDQLRNTGVYAPRPPLLWLAAWKNHCSIYPLPDTFVAAHAEALRGYRRTKGSLHFTAQAPLPETLVEHLVRQRLADLEGAGD